MMLSEDTSVTVSMLPIATMKDHLRLGTGFADDGLQDGLIAAYLRAALATLEARTGKALLSRHFKLEQNTWHNVENSCLPLPIAPASKLISFVIRDAKGVMHTIDKSGYSLIPDMARPQIKALSSFPAIEAGGLAQIVFEAGFGSDWSAIPPDLAQAALLLAAEFYERRHEGVSSSSTALPMAVQALIEPWRIVRSFSRARQSEGRL